MSASQQILLVVLPTLIGWHFGYEGYVKRLRPAWGQDGLPLNAWSSSAYLRGATGPFASVFNTIAYPDHDGRQPRHPVCVQAALSGRPPMR